MTAQRFCWCLKLLRLSQSRVGLMVGSSTQLSRKWGNGERGIPEPVAEWLEACVRIRLEHPFPPPPRYWRTRWSRRGIGTPTMRVGNQRIW